MTDQIVEAVARALCSQDASTNPDLHAQVWPIYERDSQAAITAHLKALSDQDMVVVPRVATDAMCRASGIHNSLGARAVYEAMITAYEEQRNG